MGGSEVKNFFSGSGSRDTIYRWTWVTPVSRFLHYNVVSGRHGSVDLPRKVDLTGLEEVRRVFDDG